MAAGSSQTTVVCPHCRSGNPPGTTSCRNCQRFLGSVAAAPQPRTPTATTPTHAPAPPVATPPVTAPRTVVRPAPTQPVPTPPSTARPPAVSPTTAISPRGGATVATRGVAAAPEDGATVTCVRPSTAAARSPTRSSRSSSSSGSCGPSLAGPRLRRGAPRRSGRTRPPPCPRRRPLALLALFADVVPAGILLRLVVGLVAGRPRPAEARSGGTSSECSNQPPPRRGPRRPGGIGGVRVRAARWSRRGRGGRAADVGHPRRTGRGRVRRAPGRPRTSRPANSSPTTGNHPWPGSAESAVWATPGTRRGWTGSRRGRVRPTGFRRADVIVHRAVLRSSAPAWPWRRRRSRCRRAGEQPGPAARIRPHQRRRVARTRRRAWTP